MLLSTFMDSKNMKQSFDSHGIYIVSVDIPQYEGYYKVGMSDKGSVASRIGDYQTMFFPIRSDVTIHLLR